jgi:hypothetical protein
MKPRNTLAQPPRAARRLLDLLVPTDQAPAILGDLLEEFSAVSSRRGSRSARSWYWRQSVKTIPHLLSAQFRVAPWRNLATALGGVLLLWLANTILMTTVSGYYPVNWPEPLRLFWLVCVPVALLIEPMAAGWIVAWTSKGREMVVTIPFSLTTFALKVILLFPTRGAGRSPLWSYFWLPIAIFVGGVIRRKTVQGSSQRQVQ